MDYEKKYNEALERAKYYHDRDNIQFLENIFPELKEGEDERIRKELTAYCQDNMGHTWHDIKQEEYIAWLERQGTPAKLSEEEQNRFAKGVLSSCASSFIDYLDAHKYEGKMCVSNGECEDIENAFHNAMWDRLHRYYCKYIEKQGEQKPTERGEEDEKRIDNLCHFLEEYGNQYYGHLTLQGTISWLKSLRPQNTWKPSDEQMEALEHFIRSIAESGFASPYDSNTKLVYSLLNDLKKLK